MGVPPVPARPWAHRATRQALGAGLLLAGCSQAVVSSPPEPRPERDGPRAPAPSPAAEETGRASWYGHPHHGRRTASGETYDMNALTAAHRTLPLGTRVLVTNVETGQAVEVRINDRGPFVDGRIIDLSWAAARRIGATGPGVIPVRVRILAEPR